MSKYIRFSNMKKLALLITVFDLAILSVTSIGFAVSANNSKTSADNACEHDGNHYSAKSASYSEAGNKEFWACCKCHESYLSNPGGTWIDHEEGYSGTLPSDHIAYDAPWEYVTSITISGKNATLNSGKETYTATVLPTTAHNKGITWSVENGTGKGSINQSGVFTPSSAGTVTIKASATDGSGIVASKQVTIVNNVTITFSNGVYSGSGTAATITWQGKIDGVTIVKVVQSTVYKNAVKESAVSEPRIIEGHKLTFTIASGYTLTKITATGVSGYCNYWKSNATWSNGSASVSGTTLTWSGSVTSQLTYLFGGTGTNELRLSTGFTFSLTKA